MKEKAKSKKKSRIRLLHQYYNYTGFYSFVWKSIKKAVIPIVLFVGALWAIDRYLLDIEEMLVTITETYAPIEVLSIFFLSESLLGLIPPELFIAWAGKSASPMLFLTFLATASYLGGVVSYWIGVSITKIPAVHKALESKMAKHIKNTRKWGGFLIIVGALLPIPFAMTSIAAGIIRFPFSSYLIFGLLRYARFYLYALVIFEMV
ncbi:VTT domain-containing protein [Christiangramia sp.]|uniref:YqaA family protein n=1 Tax=Christiangramia sp. TaxID=1931228 RepID=UPI00260F4671|nr:VTT domain-containing protein [Christiangramia sp.]